MELESTAYDMVLALRKKLAAGAINIAWPTAERMASSSRRKSSRRGPGDQFFGQKVYDPADGDDPRRIDYNATAGSPEDELGDRDIIIQTFKNPRIVRVQVFLSVDKSMNLGSVGTFKSLLGALCAGCGIQSAQKTGDLASFTTYTHQPVTVFKAQHPGRLLLPALMRAVQDMELETPPADWRAQLLGDQEPTPVKGGGLALSLSTTPQKSRNVTLIVSDFVNMNDDDWEALRVCGIRNDTIAVFVQDLRERELPDVPFPGRQYTVEDFQGTTRSFWVAPDKSSSWYLNRLRRMFGSVTTPSEYRESFRVHEADILQRLQECGVNTLVVSTEKEDEAAPALLSMLASTLRS